MFNHSMSECYRSFKEFFMDQISSSLVDTLIETFEDKPQGYLAFNLLLRLHHQYKFENVNWKYDDEIKFLILTYEINGEVRVVVPFHFTYYPTPKFLREITKHFEKKFRCSQLYLAFSTSSLNFVMYNIQSGLKEKI